jgi:hypothetical protein
MPNPLELLTKPLQIGAQIAFGAIGNIQKLIQGAGGGDHQEEPPQDHQKLQREEQERQGQRPSSQRRPAARNAKPKQLDDATITDKVETILFRDDDVDKGKIDVNTADGVVYLRGQAKTPQQIKALEAQTRAIPEVKGVENLLHLPKTPAPTRADTPRPQQKSRRTKGTAAARKRTTPKRTTTERKTPATANAEPTPKELASKREGRQPAPLGSSGESSGSGGSTATGATSQSEPSPREAAQKGEGRKPAPLGSTGNGSSGSGGS